MLRKFLNNEIIKKYDRYLICVDSDFTDESTFTVYFELLILFDLIITTNYIYRV